jgi:hypothetical protein
MPISTVHYNVKQLQDAGLVVVEEFHYSKKGKEVNHYTLANKYIIIAPKSEDSRFLNALNKILPIIIITAGVAFVMQLFNVLNSATKAEVTIAGDNMLRAAAPVAQEASRPAFQSMPAAYFLVGGISVIIIYFIYELVRKR